MSEDVHAITRALRAAAVLRRIDQIDGRVCVSCGMPFVTPADVEDLRGAICASVPCADGAFPLSLREVQLLLDPPREGAYCERHGFVEHGHRCAVFSDMPNDVRVDPDLEDLRRRLRAFAASSASLAELQEQYLQVVELQRKIIAGEVFTW